jgi:[FeFe] hydrogenase H-cluster maturation GTPase HydF
MDNRRLKSSRAHIGIFGRRNVGKSSLINVLSGQDTAIVSHLAGTTTDPVQKTMEIHGLGPVVVIDTPGIDDTGELGRLRIERTIRTIDQIDMAILVIEHNIFGDFEQNLAERLSCSRVPFLIVHNKSDVSALDLSLQESLRKNYGIAVIDTSAIGKKNIDAIIDSLRDITPPSVLSPATIIGDLVSYGDVVLLVTPIDMEAPEGRLILPQVQTIRDCLDNDCITVIVKERELDAYWKKVGIEPRLVVTDSQVFLKTAASVPPHVPLTSFSILFARLKGAFDRYIEGTPRISSLRDGDTVLIMESCAHHVASDDIGRVKIPRWLSTFTGKKLNFEIAPGLDAPARPVWEYSLVIQCGGCMITRKQIMQRLRPAIEAGVPVSNYGMTIAYCLGIYERAMAPFLHEGSNSMVYL